MPEYTQTAYGLLEAGYARLHKEIAELHARKNHDYGETNVDPFANFRRAERVGVEPWRGAVVRMMDKVARIETFCTTGDLKNEGFRDGLLDLANYALIALSLWEEAQVPKVTNERAVKLAYGPAANSVGMGRTHATDCRCSIHRDRGPELDERAGSLGPPCGRSFGTDFSLCTLPYGHDGSHRDS